MLASDVINFSVVGEIRLLSVAKVADGDADKLVNEATLLSYINQGIIAIYTKFGLAHQARTLENVVDDATYTMAADYLYMVYAEDNLGVEIPINDEFSEYSIFEPAPFSIFVVKDDLKFAESTEIYVTYVAVPPLLTDVSDTIPMGYQFLQALLMYIAYKAKNPVATAQEAGTNSDYINFLGACREIRNQGLITSDNQSNYKHDTRGFG